MRKTRNSQALEISKRRLEKLRSIDPALDLGGGMSIAAFAAAIDQLEGYQATYNQTLSDLDGQLSVIKDKEVEIRELRDRFLKLIGGKFGTNSTEYTNAGGTRKSERKKRNLKKVMPKLPSP